MNDVAVRNNKDPRGQGMFSRTGQFTSELNPILMIRDDLITGKKPVFKIQKGTMKTKEETSEDNGVAELTALQKLALETQDSKVVEVVPQLSKLTGRDNHFISLYRANLESDLKRLKSKRIKQAMSLPKLSHQGDQPLSRSVDATGELAKAPKLPIVPEPPKVEPHQKQKSVLEYSRQMRVTAEIREKLSLTRIKAETARQQSMKSLAGLHPHICRGGTPPKTYKQGIIFDKFTPRETTRTARLSQEGSRPSVSVENSQTTYSLRFFDKTVGQFAKAPKPPNFTEVVSLTKNMAYEPSFRLIEQKRGGFPGFSKTTGRNGRDPLAEAITKPKPTKRRLFEFEKSSPMVIDRSRRTTQTSHQIPVLENSRTAFNPKTETLSKMRGVGMDRGLPRYADPHSKLPAWMQKGVFLRGMHNEKFFEGVDAVQNLPAADKDKDSKKVHTRETAEEYLAKWYLMAQSLQQAPPHTPTAH